jgi:hypothetical protein
MASYNKHQIFPEDLAEKIHNLSADTLKILLTNSAPLATNTIKSNLTEISAGNGYTAGGTAASITSSGHTSGTYKLVLGDVVFTASGGTIGPFRYAELYNDTPTANSQGANADPLIAWWDYGSSITLADGESFTVDFDGTTGVLTIA